VERVSRYMEFSITNIIVFVVVLIAGGSLISRLWIRRSRYDKVVATKGMKVMSPSTALVACIVSTALGCITVLPYLAAATMMFDAPGVTESVLVWISFTVAFMIPVLMVGLVIRAWVLYSKSNYQRASFAAILASTLAVSPFVLLILWPLH